MKHEFNELKKIVDDFISILAYESHKFALKYNAQIDLVLSKYKQGILKSETVETIKHDLPSGYTRPLQINDDMSPHQIFIYPKDAAKLLGVGTTKFYTLNKLPGFPKPRNPLGKRPMYIRSELEAWAKNLE